VTIEHVMPQTLSPAWEADLTKDLADDETVESVHARWVHTLGNLTLTGYNPALGNRPFEIKRAKLATSGISMNQEIAEQERWGPREIQQRAGALAERAIRLWPGPVGRDVSSDSGSQLWKVMEEALAELPTGAWTTYGDLAVLIGSHARPVGNRLVSASVPNAHRVLQGNGTLSPAFRWLEPTRTDDPLEILREEGVVFDEHGRADPAQRMTAQDLAELIGRSTDDLEAVPDPDDGGDAERRDRFVELLSEAQPTEVVTGVLRLLEGWTGSGGQLDGRSRETSCFLMADRGAPGGKAVWPLVIYPSGAVEVVFQHLAVRPPFDDLALREELRARLDDVAGIRIAQAKLQLRPSFPVAVLADEDSRCQVLEVLRWFRDVTRARSA
jgi:alkylated DNA nucleotide flippase Atl1